MDKIQVSQDKLKIFLDANFFSKAAIAKKMGVSESIVGDCFNHLPNRHGKPLSFSKKNIVLLNQALQQIAEELKECNLECSNEESATKRFINDDPAVIEDLRTISKYIKLRALLFKLFEWGHKKCENNINLKDPNPHVHIGKEEAQLLSTTILSIATTLANWEVVADDDSSSSSN